MSISLSNNLGSFSDYFSSTVGKHESHLINHRSGHWNFFSWVSSKTPLAYINIAVTFIYYFTSVVGLSKLSLESKAVE